MLDFYEVMDRLERYSSELDAAMRGIVLRKDYYLFDWALALLMWKGAAAARALDALIVHNWVEVVGPVFRYLFEVGIDLAYLATRPAAEKERVAAYSFAWRIWQGERLRSEVTGTDLVPPWVAAVASSSLEPVVFLEGVCANLVELGVDDTPLRDAFREIERKPGVLKQHWSGRPRTQVFEAVADADHPAVPKQFLDWARQLWSVTSTEAHSVPDWLLVQLDVGPGDRVMVPESFESDSDTVLEVTDLAANFLGYFAQLARVARGLELPS